MRSVLVLATVIAACALCGIVVVGCLGKPRYECGGNADCLNGVIQGACEPDGFCSFPDSSCPSGSRYGDLSGPQAGQCVGVPIDAPPDAYIPDAYVHDARECFGGSGAYELCFDMMPPMGDLAIAGALDTGTDARCMAMPAGWATAGQPDACLLMGKAVTIATVTVTGTRALVVLGDTIEVTGTLGVASLPGQPAGPGAPAIACGTTFVQDPALNTTGAGGGAGGSFKTKGGDGGSGKGGSAKGLANPAVTNPTILRAGCPGQTGGTGLAAAGAPGQGGGAVFLTASKITLGPNAIINASGAGGLATTMLSGGSGGGSGGMIVLHAAESITAMTGAKMLANGGGGSSGAAGAGAGVDGGTPATANPNIAAPGGDGGNGAGDGGNGFAGSTQAASGQDAGGNRDTGGAGGGGSGFIQTNMMISNLVTSPGQTVVP